MKIIKLCKGGSGHGRMIACLISIKDYNLFDCPGEPLALICSNRIYQLQKCRVSGNIRENTII